MEKCYAVRQTAPMIFGAFAILLVAVSTRLRPPSGGAARIPAKSALASSIVA
jgi:hypothetical protein